MVHGNTRPLPPLPPPATSQTSAVPITLPHVVATFTGEFFKGVVGAMEVVPFTESVMIPHTWLLKEELNPVFVFRHKFAKKLMRKYPGYSDVRTVYLKDTTELPDGMTVESELNWTADFTKLVTLAQRYAKKISFIPLDPKEGTPLPREDVGVRPEYYADENALRNAIKRCMAEPQAFKAEQDRLSRGYEVRKNELTMQEEMAALYPNGF